MAVSTAILSALGVHGAAWSHPGASRGYGEPKAALTQAYYPANADCLEYTVPVSVSYDRLSFNFTHWEDDNALQQFLADVTTRSGANFPGVVDGSVHETASYNISASFCSPKVKNGKEKTVVVATHGIGPAREHWNSAYKPEEYNFVQFAASQGYSTWFYDRVSCGFSSV